MLGTLEVQAHDDPVGIGGPTPRRLLCALLAHVGSAVPTDSLVDAVWGEHPPRSAEKTLQSHLTRVREALTLASPDAPPRLERRGDGYALIVDASDVDAVRFEELVRTARDATPGETVELLDEALDLWRGPVPYADLQDTRLPPESGHLQQVRLDAFRMRAAAQIAAGRAADAVADLEALVVDEPYQERLWELLVLALYRQGRQADALSAYRRARAVLLEGLGVEPGPGLRELHGQVLDHDPALLEDAAARPRTAPCPYKGLAGYEAEDAALYVGREHLVAELVGRLVDRRLLVVTGPSGAGKSSLVRAGLLPALADGAVPGADAWTWAVVRPGRDSAAAVTAALTECDLAVIDQAEEAPLTWDTGSGVSLGDRLVDAVDAGIRVVLVIRTDFYGRLSEHPELARRAGPATVLVSPPGERDLRRIVAEPAVRSGLRVEPALVDRVVAEVRGRPGVLPVLSTALVRTWEHREADALTLEAYRAGGGVAGALRRVGEEAWAALGDDDERAACRRILLRLATVSEGRWVRRRASRAEVVPAGDAVAERALGVLTAGRLLVTRADDVEIAHEAVLTGWPRLNAWLEEARSGARVREQLTAAVLSWDAAGRDPAELYRGTRLQAALDLTIDDLTATEKAFLEASADEAGRELREQRDRADREARGRRRLRAVVGGLVVTLVGAGLVGGYALHQQRAAQDAAQVSRAATRAADSGRLGAIARAGGAVDRDLLLALEGFRLDPRSPTSQSNLFATLEADERVTRSLGYTSAVSYLAAAPNGHRLAAATLDGHIFTSDLRTGRRLDTINLHRPIGHIGWTPDGRDLQVALQDGPDGPPLVETIDPVTGIVLATGPRADPYAWTYTTGNRWLVSTNYLVIPDNITGFGENSGLVVWKPDHPSVTSTIPLGGHIDDIASCGPSTVCALQNGKVRRVRLPHGPVGPPVDVGRVTGGLLSSPDGRLLAVGHYGLVELRDSRTGHVVRRLTGASGNPDPLSFSPDGSRLAAADVNQAILVWDTRTTAPPVRLADAGDDVAVWSADGKTLVTRAGGVLTWDLGGRHELGRVLTETLPGDGQFPTHNSTAWGAKDTVVVAGRSGWLAFLDQATGQMTVPHSPHTHPIGTARAGRAGNPLVTTDESGRTAVWDVPSRRLLGLVSGLPAPDARHAADAWVSPDGRLAATLRNARGIVVFDVRRRRVVRRLPPLPGDRRFTSYVDGWTGDGRSVAVIRQRADQSGIELLLVDARSGRRVLRIRAPMGSEAALDPRGRWVAIGGYDGKLRFYSQTDGHPLAPAQPASGGPIFNVSTTLDGHYVTASGGAVATVPLFDTRTFRRTGVDLPIPQPGDDAATRTRFALDGSLIVVEKREVQLFPIGAAAWTQRACRVVGRNLTHDEWREALPGRPYEQTCPRR